MYNQKTTDTFIGDRRFVFIELVILAIVIPTTIIVFQLAPFMFNFLWTTTAYCVLILALTKRDRWRDIWKWSAVTWDNLKPMLTRWVLATLFMIAFTWVLFPDKLFMIPRERPELLPTLLVLYPLLSAIPQEFIFCTFFFKRYEPFFGKGTLMLLASALVFAYAHVLYINWVAPLLGLFAGIIFAQTYLKTKSLALVSIEHGLYGNSLFVIGLGWFFWTGAVGQH